MDAAFAVPDAYDQRGVILREVERMGDVTEQQNLGARGQCSVSGCTQSWMFEVTGGFSQTSLYKFMNSSNTIHHQGQGIIDRFSALLENKHDYNTECLQILTMGSRNRRIVGNME